MPVQITPFNPVNLSDLVRDKRNFNADQQQRGIANAQNERRLAQGGQRIKITEAQLTQAAKAAGQKREEYMMRVFDEAVGSHPDKESTAQFMANSFAEFDPRSLDSVPKGRFGWILREQQAKEAKAERDAMPTFTQPMSVVNPDDGTPALMQFSNTGEARDTGFVSPPKPLTVTDQIKLEERDKALEAKARDSSLIAETAKSLLESGAFKAAYGTIDSLAPTFLQSTADAESDIGRIVSLLSLDARGKLVGTGQISDFESKQLEKSATILADFNISDEKAEQELRNIAEIFGGIQPRQKSAGPALQSKKKSILEKYGLK